MQSVRVGVIGMGNMGRYHADYLSQGKVPRCTLSAVATSVPDKASELKNVHVYSECEALIRSGQVDAVLICTPHYSHTTLGILALENGAHVMVEKPISVHKADCERLASAAQKSGKVFGAMF